MASILQLFPNSRPDSINRKIFRAALIVGLLSVLARIAGTSKELVVAHALGRSDALDAFLIAFLLPSFAVSLLMGALGSALLPVLVNTREKEGLDSAAELLSSIVCLSAIVLVMVGIILGLCAPIYLPLVAHNFPPAKLLLTQRLLYLLLPWILFSGLATILAYTMNAGEKFAIPALVPLITPLVTMSFLLSAHGQYAFWLAGGTVLGGLMEWLVLLRVVWGHGMRMRFRWSGFTRPVRTIISQYLPMLAGAFLMGGTTVVDQAIAAMLPAGSVAALNYATKISGAILLIGATALSTAAFPYLSKMIAENDWHSCRHTLKRYVVLITAVTVPSTLLLIVFSNSIVRILFERGAFTIADTRVVGMVQACSLIQLPFHFLCILLARFISAVKRNDLLMYASAVNLTVNVLMDLVLMRIFGIAGIALSTSIETIVSLIFLSIASVHLVRRHTPSVIAEQVSVNTL